MLVAKIDNAVLVARKTVYLRDNSHPIGLGALNTVWQNIV